jgi:nucleotide-binding universal stress UspA family protein
MLFPQFRQDARGMQEIEGKAAAAVAGRVREVTGHSADEYIVTTDTGSPHSGILLIAERVGPGVIVLGAGGVAGRVVRHAPCPVLVARPSPSGAVLGATDFSDPSFPAIETTVSEASRRGVAPCLIHSLELTPLQPAPRQTGLGVPAIPDHLRVELEADARKRLEARLEGLGAPGACLVHDGPAALEILRAARELPAQLVVLGTRGRTGLARLTLGSVAEAVLSDAPCSVLVVRLHEG